MIVNQIKDNRFKLEYIRKDKNNNISRRNLALYKLRNRLKNKDKTR